MCCAAPAAGEPRQQKQGRGGADGRQGGSAGRGDGTLHAGRSADEALARATLFSVSEVEALRSMYRAAANALHTDDRLHRSEFKLALFKTRGEGRAAPLPPISEDSNGAGKGVTATGTGSVSPPKAGSPGGSRGTSAQGELFADRVFDLMDTERGRREGRGWLSFEGFVHGLQVFHPRASDADKTSFLFEVYDLNSTGCIEQHEVRAMLTALLAERAGIVLPPDAMDSLIAETFQQADLAQDGVIHAEEWEKLCQRQPHILAPMTLDVLRELTSAFPSFIESTSVFVQGSALGADSARLPACANSAHMGNERSVGSGSSADSDRSIA